MGWYRWTLVAFGVYCIAIVWGLWRLDNRDDD